MYYNMKNTKPTLFEQVWEHYKTTRPRKFKKPKRPSPSRVINDQFESKEFKRNLNRLSKTKPLPKSEPESLSYEDIFG